MKVSDFYEMIPSKEEVFIDNTNDETLFHSSWRYVPRDFDECEVLSVYGLYQGGLVLVVDEDKEG